MSKKSKRRKTVELREKNRVKQPIEVVETSSVVCDRKKAEPVLTGMLVASAVLIAAISLFDGNGVYEEYLKTHESVPNVLACVDAIGEDIFPWTELTAYAAVYTDDVNDGPGVVQENADVKVGSAAGAGTESNATEAAGAESDVAIADNNASVDAQSQTSTQVDTSVIDSSQTGPSTNVGNASTTDTSSDAQAIGPGETSTFSTVDMSYFSDAVFVGDSFTQGLMVYADVPGADFLCYQSMTTSNILDGEIQLRDGSKSTVRTGLSKKQYKKVYILLGINELSKDVDKFAARYQKVIDEVRKLQPEAIVYVQSIFHTTAEKSANSVFKNDLIDLNNTALAGLADNKTVFYVDLNPLFDDGTGAMKADHSGDGVHFKATHYNEWRDYLLKFGIVR